MREFTAPALARVDRNANLTDFIVNNAAHDPHHVSFRRRIGSQWHDVTAGQFLYEVTEIAQGFIAAGINPGDRVAILSRTRYEWTLVDFAIWSAGAVTVPIYETSSAEQVQWILSDSRAVACIAETPELSSVVADLKPDLPQLHAVWQIEDAPPPGDVGSFTSLRRNGVGIPEAVVEARRSTVNAESIATLIYTSGTTGRPKGCALTHQNFLAEVMNVTAQLGEIFERPNCSTLLFLPLAHVFARVIQLASVYQGVTLGHSSDVKNLLDDFAAFRPTFLLAVPRVFEKVYNSATQKAEAAGKGKIFARAVTIAIAYSEAIETGTLTPKLRMQRSFYSALVYRKLRKSLGGRATHAISGGSALGSRLGHFYRGIGLTVLEGYGLTETTAAITVNPSRGAKIGTVGQPVPGTTIRIADDGEVLAKGPIVFGGYWRNEAATDDAIDPQGWFHTGDIGALDEDGFLSITGRKKEIIVTAGGKNVAPAVIEDRIRAHALVSQVMVVGDNEPFIGALITVDEEALEPWKATQGKTGSVTDLLTDPDLLAAIDEAVQYGNKAVSKAESVRKYHIIARDWTVEQGQLTPSMKLKRNVVMKEHEADINAIYGR
ncbi:long-chain fatty acid--CoA ligase [Hoyosella rhizosphaerae]|uniref:Acyl-CoA synthetase n=1 Tax=Hoyosella rhizosphaerae TaxID=1755582 RepID=A0A916UB08_9ACTN|nr:long-chain fatty acid--CoA ligase [Hoyosella rhizosphaerae]MBN4926079.1 long-chain fatty acid--CoA ligase [Hoyosella rhizosphaerae]GGC65736.1 long-chain-fatty-acid--CoA ligase [Hoyosella rhizosphaerae]